MFRSALIVYVQYVSQERLFLFNRRYLPDPTQVGRIYALAGHCPKVSLTRTAKDPSAKFTAQFTVKSSLVPRHSPPAHSTRLGAKCREVCEVTE